MHTKDDSAWIFDLDGTLVQTQKEFHAPAEVAVLAKHGIKMREEEISSRFAGVHTLEVFRQLAPAKDPHILLEEKWRRMKIMAATHPIKEIDGAQYVIHQLNRKSISIGIASASPMLWIMMCLSAIHVVPYFDCYTSVDEVSLGKPAPDVFLLAAERLGYAPKDCIAVEDGRAGVHAALSAGMTTYWLTESAEVILGAKKIRSLRELV
jgi:beta-phosphoglucomutase-like phosphatase (HAD superfamily)